MKTRLISAVLIVSLIAGGFAAYRLTRDERPTFTVTADVEQAPNLFENGRVMVRGVEVGTITDVEPRAGVVRVQMEIFESVKVPNDAELMIVPITVISDRYVQLVPAYTGGPVMKDGAHIPAARTSIPAELDNVVTQLKELLGALEPAPGEEHGPLARLIRNVDSVVAGRDDEIQGTLKGSSAVLENLADSSSDISSLIGNLDQLFLALANRSSEIGLINERFALVGKALLADRAHLEGTIENVAALSDEAHALISESGDDLARTFRRLEDVMAELLENEAELVKGMKWTNVIAQGLGATDGSGRGLFAYSGKQSSPEYSYRIDTRDTISCERIQQTAEVKVEISPDATPADLLLSLLTFIPDEYDDDLRYLIRDLIDLCAADVFAGTAGTSSLDARTQSLVQELADRVGEKRLTKMLAKWTLFGEGALP